MDWDELCWNPYEESAQQGENSGREAGELAGFRDGKAMGQVKGFELGMEIGFIRGFLEALEDENLIMNERIQRSIEQLQKVLEEESFQPGNIFQESQLLATKDQPTRLDDDEDSEKPTSEESKVDVESKLQRIRARFKVLAVQLKMPKPTLRDVMDEAAKSTSSMWMKQESAPAFDGEW